jgi:Na+-driven multidrug efflux pump
LTRALATCNGRDARELVSAGLLSASIVGIVVGGLLHANGAVVLQFLGLQTQANATMEDVWRGVDGLALNYIHLRAIGLPLALLPLLIVGVYRALGHAQLAALLLCCWVALTVIFELLWVKGAALFGLVTLAAQGVTGIAHAHLLADGLFSLVGIYLLGGHERLLAMPHDFFTNAKKLFVQAAPSIINNALMPIALAIITHDLAKSGLATLATLGMALRLEAALLLLPMALTMSFSIFAGQNWAAGFGARVRDGALMCVHLLVITQLVIAVICLLFANTLALLASSYGLSFLGILSYLSIVPFSYGALAISILLVSTLCAIGREKAALIFNTCRIFILYVPASLFAYSHWGDEALYWGIFCGNVLAGFWAYQLLKDLLRPPFFKLSPHRKKFSLTKT